MFFPYFPLFTTRQQNLNQRDYNSALLIWWMCSTHLGNEWMNGPEGMPMVVEGLGTGLCNSISKKLWLPWSNWTLRLILGHSYMPVGKSCNPSIAPCVSVSMTSLWDKPIGLPMKTYKKILAEPQILWALTQGHSSAPSSSCWFLDVVAPVPGIYLVFSI